MISPGPLPSKVPASIETVGAVARHIGRAERCHARFARQTKADFNVAAADPKRKDTLSFPLSLGFSPNVSSTVKRYIMVTNSTVCEATC